MVRDRVSLCNRCGYLGTHFVNKVGLKLRDTYYRCLPSAGVKAFAATTWLSSFGFETSL